MKRVFVALSAAILLAGQANAQSTLERGRYLVEVVAACGNCHTPQGPNGPIVGKTLAGGLLFDEDGFKAVSANITPDKDTGIGAWSDAQIVVAIREGKRPDGSTIGPPMPFELYRAISDSDVKAMVAYLRTVKPVASKVAKSSYSFPLPPAYGPKLGVVPDVPRTDKLVYGAYLAGPVAHCLECHTPMGAAGRRQFNTAPGAGGFAFKGPWGTSAAANITPDKQTGIGNKTDAQLKRAITQGIGADGHKMLPPMGYGYYRRINSEDLDAIIAYLRSLKPIR